MRSNWSYGLLPISPSLTARRKHLRISAYIADAVYYHKCSRCESRGATTWIKEGSALGHEWGEYHLDGDQTCTYDGHKTAECTREGCSEENKIVATGAALGHLFTEYLSNGDATTEADGHKTAECDRGCGATDTVIDEGSRIVETPTGITNVESGHSHKAIKTIENGRVVIIRDGVRYDLAGRKL